MQAFWPSRFHRTYNAVGRKTDGMYYVDPKTYLLMIRDILAIAVRDVVLMNNMAVFCHFFSIDPSYGAPSKLGQHCVLHFPGLKVDGQPNASFLAPKRSDSFKRLTNRHETRISSLETFVIFVNHLL